MTSLFRSVALTCSLPCAALLLVGPASSQANFVDVTLAAGIDYIQGGPVTTQHSEHVSMSGGAAAGDVDGDGWVDLFVTRLDAACILYRNLGRDASGHLGFADHTDHAFFGRARNDGIWFSRGHRGADGLSRIDRCLHRRGRVLPDDDGRTRDGGV